MFILVFGLMGTEGTCACCVVETWTGLTPPPGGFSSVDVTTSAKFSPTALAIAAA